MLKKHNIFSIWVKKKLLKFENSLFAIHSSISTRNLNLLFDWNSLLFGNIALRAYVKPPLSRSMTWSKDEEGMYTHLMQMRLETYTLFSCCDSIPRPIKLAIAQFLDDSDSANSRQFYAIQYEISLLVVLFFLRPYKICNWEFFLLFLYSSAKNKSLINLKKLYLP